MTLVLNFLDADLSLATFHNDKFLLRGGSGEDDFSVVLQHIVKQLWAHVFQLTPVDNAGLGIPGEEITAALGQQLQFHIMFLRGTIQKENPGETGNYF